MADSTPQEKGRAYERRFAKARGAEPVPQSGAGIYKLDAGQRQLLWSLKWTGARSFRVDEEMLRELDRATSGAGGIGHDVTGLLVVRLEPLDREVFVGDVDDIVRLLESDAQLIPPSKDTMKRARSRVPGLFRED